MLVRRGFAGGGPIVGVVLLWLLLTVLSLITSTAPYLFLAFAFVLLAVLVLAVRRPGWGWPVLLALLLFGILVGLGFDEEGAWNFILACSVVLLVGQGKWWRAGVVTAAGVGLFFIRLLLPEPQSGGSDPGRDGIFGLVGTGLWLVGAVPLAWLVGMGFRLVALNEANRVSRAYAERQTQMAMDIHDFVGRNLAGLLVQAEAANQEQWADPEFVDGLMGRVRSADATLRSVTADLQRDEHNGALPAVSAVGALTDGIAELRAAGITVEAGGGVSALLGSLPPEADLVVSRIAAEALHNVAKHGDKTRPCSIDAQADDGSLTLTITNGVGPRRGGERSSLGLVAMRRHAALAGGTVTAGPAGDGWQCRAVIPIVRMGGVSA